MLPLPRSLLLPALGNKGNQGWLEQLTSIQGFVETIAGKKPPVFFLMLSPERGHITAWLRWLLCASLFS